MQPLIDKLKAGLDLNSGEVGVAVGLLLSDTVEDSVKADFLEALHRKGETVDEIVSFARQLMERAVDPVIDPKSVSGPMVDVCGTGGDGVDLFNVSTTVMFILAAGGAVVMKHGNHQVTSRSGSADVLKELGVPIDLSSERLRECAQRLGLGFVAARQYHPVYQMIAEVRSRLDRRGSRTILSLLGPLLNPTRPMRQLIGVYSSRLTGVFAEVLRRLGRERAWIVHGTTDTGDGLDEISTCGATILAELTGGKVISGVIDSRWLNIPASTLDDLRGGDARENAAHIEGILSGEIQGAKRDLVVVNAAGGFVVAGLAPDMSEGISLAREQINSGRALGKLQSLRQFQSGS